MIQTVHHQTMNILILFFLFFGWLVDHLPPLMPGFNSNPVHMGFVVHYMAMR